MICTPLRQKPNLALLLSFPSARVRPTSSASLRRKMHTTFSTLSHETWSFTANDIFGHLLMSRHLLCTFISVAPEITVSEQLTGVGPGADVTLKCKVEAHPSAITYWMKGETEMLLSGPKYKISDSIINDYESNMRLTIKNWEATDKSHYTCISTNSLGKSEGKIQAYSKFQWYVHTRNTLKRHFFVALNLTDPELDAKNRKNPQSTTPDLGKKNLVFIKRIWWYGMFVWHHADNSLQVKK